MSTHQLVPIIPTRILSDIVFCPLVIPQADRKLRAWFGYQSNRMYLGQRGAPFPYRGDRLRRSLSTLQAVTAPERVIEKDGRTEGYSQTKGTNCGTGDGDRSQ
jgi:hypothetical protein